MQQVKLVAGYKISRFSYTRFFFIWIFDIHIFYRFLNTLFTALEPQTPVLGWNSFWTCWTLCTILLFRGLSGRLFFTTWLKVKFLTQGSFVKQMFVFKWSIVYKTSSTLCLQWCVFSSAFILKRMIFFVIFTTGLAFVFIINWDSWSLSFSTHNMIQFIGVRPV